MNFGKKTRFFKMISWLTASAFTLFSVFSPFTAFDAFATVDPALAGTTQVETFFASGAWTVPEGISNFTIKLLGAGGKGGNGGVSNVYAGYNGPGGGGGGGAGAYVEKTFPAVVGTNYNFVIGDKAINDGASVFKTADGGILIGATAGTDGGNGADGTVVGNGGLGGIGGTSLPGTLPDLAVAGFAGSSGAQGTYIYGCSDGFSQPGNGGSGGSSNLSAGGSGGLAPACSYTQNGLVGSVGSGGGGGSGYSGLGALGGKGQVAITYTYPAIPTDTTAPVVTLLGANPIYLTQGSTFTDPGATATDNFDGLITVTTTGSVNTAVVGSYTLTYTATDSSSNTTTATRTVIVYNPLADISCPTTGSLPTVANIGSFSVLAWPSTDTTSILQSSIDLLTWTNITTVPTTVNGCNTVSTTTPATPTFYQLVAPGVPAVTPTVAFTLTPSSTSGTAPLNGVTFAVTVSGTATGDSVLSVDCDNNGVSDFGTTTSQTSFTTENSCAYSSAGTYTAHANITRGGVSNTTDTIITVSAPAGNNNNGGGGTGGGNNGGGGGVPPGANGPISGTLVTSTGGSISAPATTPPSGGGIIASTPTEETALSCKYLDVYLGKQKQNDQAEVLKLQAFLRDTEKIEVPVNGIFDDETEVAVKVFQTKYSADILEPWATTTPTGYAYITTVKKINDIFCGSLDSNYKPAGLPELIPDTTIPVGAGSQIGSTATSSSLALTSEDFLKGQNFEATSTLPSIELIGLNIGGTNEVATNSPPVIVRIRSNTAAVFNAIGTTVLDALRALWERLKQ